LLVVIGIILVLMSIIVIGFRHVNYTSATKETIAELHTCRDLLQEYQNLNGRGNIEVPTGAGQSPLTGGPPLTVPALNLFPVYVDDPVGTAQNATQSSPPNFIPLNDLGVNGGQQTDMGDKSFGLNTARYNAMAVRRTYDVMYLLLRDPKNRALVSAMPPKRLLEGQVSGNGTQSPSDITHAIVLDGWGNPIIYVPAGGLHVQILDTSSGSNNLKVEYVVRSTGMFPASQLSSHPISAADRPFWASAGQDGDFSKGEDNVYSFQE